MISIVKGKVWKFGDNINTDVIYPGRYLKSYLSLEEMARHVMEGAGPEFAKGVQQGDILVAGRNFGCGSSREEAVSCLKAAKVGLVIAESFARIFYRNAINVGLPLLECKNIGSKVKNGDMLEANVKSGTIRNLATGEVIQAKPLPDFMLKILDKGGLIPYAKEKLTKLSSSP